MIRPRQPFATWRGNTAAGDPAKDLKYRADRICALIVASDYPDVDIDIEISGLRRWCEKHFPDRGDLFEMVYVSRFQRLREQFRP